MTDTNTAEREAATDGKWYMVNKDGMATLCADEADAEREAADAQAIWPGMGPHRAVQLVEAGRASLAASAGSEPVIGWHAFPHYLQHPDGRLLRTASDLLARHGYTGCAEPLRAMSDVLLSTNPSPPEGMAEQALRQVLSVVQRYLPPDGPSAHDAMSEITAIVDPWPLGPLEKP